MIKRNKLFHRLEELGTEFRFVQRGVTPKKDFEGLKIARVYAMLLFPEHKDTYNNVYLSKLSNEELANLSNFLKGMIGEIRNRKTLFHE